MAAAWSLFKKQGYEDTTIDEIIDEADVSRGTFYYYFNGKDDLLSSLSIFFDDKYEEVMQQIDPKINSFDKLLKFKVHLDLKRIYKIFNYDSN